MRRSSVLGALVVSAVLVTACGNSGPVALSLASSQARSGETRMESDADFREPESLPLSVKYSVKGTLPYLGDRLLAWSIGRRSKPAGEVEKLAASFAVNGEVEKVNDSLYVVNDSVRKRSVNVWVDDAGGWWTYSDQSSQSSAASSPGCPAGGACEIPPAAPAPAPEDLIEPGDALRRTNQYLSRADMVPLNYGLQASKTGYSTEVSGPLTLGGVETNIGVSFTYGTGGVLVSASGPMIAIAMAGRYPIISPMEAVKRLSNPLYGAIGSAVRNAADIAVSSPQPGSAAAPGEIEVPISGVRLILMETRLANGTHMLLPAYTFTNAEGDVGTVIAVADDRLAFRRNLTTSTSAPPPDDGASEPAPVEPGVLPQEEANTLVGLTEAEAIATARERGWPVRIAAREGEYYMLTSDYVTNRVNLVIDDLLVVSVEVG